MNAKMKLTALLMVFGFLTPQVSWAGMSAADQQALLAKKKAELNGHAWDVNLASTADPKKVVSTDTLLFRDLKFESKNMTGKGFNVTNYTISLQEGGPTVWETIQSDDKGQSVFWRGEWEGEFMKGVMSKQSGDGKNEDYYFSSVASKAIPDTPKEEPKKEEVKAEAEAAKKTAKAEVKDKKAAAKEAAKVKKEAAAKKTEPVKNTKDKPKKKWF